MSAGCRRISIPWVSNVCSAAEHQPPSLPSCRTASTSGRSDGLSGSPTTAFQPLPRFSLTSVLCRLWETKGSSTGYCLYWQQSSRPGWGDGSTARRVAAGLTALFFFFFYYTLFCNFKVWGQTLRRGKSIFLSRRLQRSSEGAQLGLFVSIRVRWCVMHFFNLGMGRVTRALLSDLSRSTL